MWRRVITNSMLHSFHGKNHYFGVVVVVVVVFFFIFKYLIHKVMSINDQNFR